MAHLAERFLLTCLFSFNGIDAREGVKMSISADDLESFIQHILKVLLGLHLRRAQTRRKSTLIAHRVEVTRCKLVCCQTVSRLCG